MLTPTMRWPGHCAGLMLLNMALCRVQGFLRVLPGKNGETWHASLEATSHVSSGGVSGSKGLAARENVPGLEDAG